MKNFSVKFVAVSAATLAVMTAVSLIGERASEITMPVLETKAAVVYTLRDYKGRIAVYEGTNTEPVEVFEVFSNSLPEEEYLRVMAGVPANSESELQELIEAYTS